jgi:hypothetical protein
MREELEAFFLFIGSAHHTHSFFRSAISFCRSNSCSTLKMAHPAQMNNDAVYLIENGKYDEAVVTLGASLKKVKLIMSGDTRILNLQQYEDGDLSCDFSPMGTSFLRTYGKPGAEVSSIFQECVVVRRFLPSSQLDKKCELVSYAILYNLALVHHLKAVKESSSGRAQTLLLTRAMSLYEHAHHILINQDVDVSLMHTMAIASNLGHVHHMLGDEQKARLCFQHLLSTIIYIVDCGDAVRIDAFDGFFTNVMPLLSAASSAAAA